MYIRFRVYVIFVKRVFFLFFLFGTYIVIIMRGTVALYLRFGF